jgi:hypothetical protein
VWEPCFCWPAGPHRYSHTGRKELERQYLDKSTSFDIVLPLLQRVSLYGSFDLDHFLVSQNLQKSMIETIAWTKTKIRKNAECMVRRQRARNSRNVTTTHLRLSSVDIGHVTPKDWQQTIVYTQSNVCGSRRCCFALCGCNPGTYDFLQPLRLFLLRCVVWVWVWQSFWVVNAFLGLLICHCFVLFCILIHQRPRQLVFVVVVFAFWGFNPYTRKDRNKAGNHQHGASSRSDILRDAIGEFWIFTCTPTSY